MRLFNKLTLVFLLVTLLLSSCRKDDEAFGSFPPTPPTPEVVVNGSIAGIVIDENNMAVTSALVKLNAKSRVTDENGYFSFQNVDINTKGSLLTIEKEGYFYNAKFVKSTLNSQNFTKVKLIERVQTGAFSASMGGNIVSTNGVSITFDANSITQEDGEMYNGVVNVYTTWLDPLSTDLPLRMPGDLRAFNTSGQQQQLTTYGMIGVELEGTSGEILNIAPDQIATITVPLPTALASNAPRSIPLWHFDEVSGYWLEEGEARLEGNAYVGDVSHFSFWNCDVPNDFVFINGTVIEEDGDPLQNVIVRITEVATGLSACDITDKGGEFSGAVPRDVELIITIIDNCGVEIYTATIGPFTEDTVLPTITANSANTSLTISGSLINCDNASVTNGYIKINIGPGNQEILPTDENGEVSGTINTCGVSTLVITAYDLDNLTQSEATSFEVTGLSRISLPNTFVCDELEEFMSFTIGETQVIDLDPYSLIRTNDEEELEIVIQGNDQDPFIINSVAITTSTTTTGSFTPSLVTSFYELSDPNPRTTTLQCFLDCEFSVDFTILEDRGGWAVGSFSGTLPQISAPFQVFEIAGTFRIRIE